jgi:hypothetical protein
MDAIINNPFRILGITQFATDKEIAKRVSDLLIYAEMGKKVSYITDLAFLGEVDRTSDSIVQASKILENPDLKLYYSLFCWNLDPNKESDLFNLFEKLCWNEERPEFKHSIESKPKVISKYGIVTNPYNDFIISIENEILTILRQRIDGVGLRKHFFKELIYSKPISQFESTKDCEINGENITLKSTSENGFWLLKEFYYDKTVSFFIEFDCEWMDGETDKLFSLIIGKDSTNSYYRLGIAANGFFYFDLIKFGIAQNLFGWKKSDSVISGKNHIKFHSRAKDRSHCFDFYINSETQSFTVNLGDELRKNPFFGNQFGFSVYGKQKVSFSNLEIYQLPFKLDYNKTRKPALEDVKNFINHIAINLCLYLNKPQSLTFMALGSTSCMGQLFDGNAIEEYAHLVISPNYKINRNSILHIFIDEIYNLLEKKIGVNGGIGIKDFVDYFSYYPEDIQFYVLSKFLGPQMIELENTIANSQNSIQINPLHGYIEAQKLMDSGSINLKKIGYLLGYANFQYGLIANKLSNRILDCTIAYFNAIRKERNATVEEGKQFQRFVNYCESIALIGTDKRRINENKEFIDRWLTDATKTNQINKEDNEKRIHDMISKIKIPKDFIEKNDLSNLPVYRNTNHYLARLYGLILFVIIIIVISIWAIGDKSNGKTASNRTNTNTANKIERKTPVIDLQKPIKSSKWEGNKLANGSSAYDNFFGSGIYDFNSECWLLFKNGNSTDAIVCLENISSGRTIRNEYIQAGTNFKMTNLPTGVYRVKVFHGNNWNPEKVLNNGLIKGAFDNDLNFSISDNYNDRIVVETTVDNDGITYTTGEITLYTVSNGNMNQRKIDSDEFFR